MILTMVDSENRMIVYRYDGKGLSQLAALKAATTDELELAQIGATLALMAGETNGTAPAREPVETADERKRRRDRERKQTKRQEMKALPQATDPKKPNPNYRPDLGSVTGKIILYLADHEWTSANDVAAMVGRPPGHVSATLSGLRDIGVIESKDGPANATGRPTRLHNLTDHGRASIARVRE